MAAPRRGVIFGAQVCCLCASRSFRTTKTALQSTRQLAAQRRLVTVASLSSDVKLDEAVELQLQKGDIKHRHHPGVLSVKSVALPESLENAIKRLIDKYPTLRLAQNAEKFCRYLKCRLPPVEDDALRQTAVRIEEEIRGKEVGTRDVTEMDLDELKTLESRVKGKVLKRLREQVYHWESIEYTAYKGFLYMVGRMDQDYAVLTRCLRELKRRDPGFSPSSVFDFGSGVGSVTWAVNSVWGSAVSEYYCVDKSGEMNTLARLLLQGGEEYKEASIAGVYFRQFHPSTQNRFDLTVSAFTLFEFPTHSERLQAVHSLWEMTDDCMILVENGSYAGYKLIQEAREYILKLGGSLLGHVFSPCPHDAVCPKLSWSKKSACTTEVKARKLQMSSNTYVYERVGFSYVILRKGSRNTELLGHAWPRMVKLSSKPQGHTPCTVCCSDGTIQNLVLTKGKHSKNLYTCSRYCNMGDLLPVSLPRQQDGAQVHGVHRNHSGMADDSPQDRTLKSEAGVEFPVNSTDTSFV